jgi:uncharacterized repeat protein (TIGR03803 family)
VPDRRAFRGFEPTRSHFFLLCCTLLAGCSNGAVGPLPVSTAANAGSAVDSAYRSGAPSNPRRDSVAFQSLYNFQGGSGDGANPQAGLLDVNGTFYGTTLSGGPAGYGTVFAIAPSGTETVLHYFGTGSGDGTFPQAGLTNVNGTLYGTTTQGGATNNGTVFVVTPSGTETLYSFKGKCNGSCSDGAYPQAPLLDVDGTLYGTTFDGGANGYGTVFAITPSGTEAVIYSFKGGAAKDGQFPEAGLINVKGTLYGTTYEGGPKEYGTVFAVTPSGTETVLHRFAPGKGDGANPAAVLVDLKGKLYGTTFDGGKYGYGTVFAITPSGKETALHSFGNSGGDGEEPEYAGLINAGGTLYGTTARGGGTNGGGTIFKITPSGKETVLYNFPRGSGSAYQPEAGLIDVKGRFYGTTYYGGTSGAGTVYSLRP